MAPAPGLLQKSPPKAAIAKNHSGGVWEVMTIWPVTASSHGPAFISNNVMKTSRTALLSMTVDVGSSVEGANAKWGRTDDEAGDWARDVSRSEKCRKR